LDVVQYGTALIDPPIHPGLAAAQPARPHIAEVALQLIQPGSRPKTKELKRGGVLCWAGGLGT
jgi:hypothetical protein